MLFTGMDDIQFARKKELPTCPMMTNDCGVLNSLHHCKALQDTNFSGNCPFFKTNEQFWREHRKNYARLIERGRRDLIDKYAMTEYGYDGDKMRR